MPDARLVRPDVGISSRWRESAPAIHVDTRCKQREHRRAGADRCDRDREQAGLAIELQAGCLRGPVILQLA